MVAVELTPFQSVKLFGCLRQPVLTLSWHDVKTSNFTWRQLRAHLSWVAHHSPANSGSALKLTWYFSPPSFLSDRQSFTA